MPFHSFLRQHPSSPIVRHHKPLPPPLPPPPAAAAPHTPAMSTSSAVEMIFEGASAKVSEGTQIALSTITHSGIAENYLTPLIRYIHRKYLESSLPVRVGMWGCLAVVTVPVTCSLGALLMVNIGCIIVTASALFAMQVSIMTFSVFVLIPLLVSVLVVVGGPTSLLIFTLYICRSVWCLACSVAMG